MVAVVALFMPFGAKCLLLVVYLPYVGSSIVLWDCSLFNIVAVMGFVLHLPLILPNLPLITLFYRLSLFACFVVISVIIFGVEFNIITILKQAKNEQYRSFK